MNLKSKTRTWRPQSGVALLISIFILMLVSVVAIAMILSSGTESALAGNYRASTGVYYAALAGLEEARGRLLTKNPNSFSSTAPGFLPPPGVPLGIGSIAYVLNPGPAENAATLLTTYPDAEYDTEFGGGALAAATTGGNVTTTLSVWNTNPLNALGISGPLYKWVRINAVSEQSLKLDTSPYDGSVDPTLVYYDGTRLNDTNTGYQVLEITALAVLPNGSQKLVQYITAPISLGLPPFLAGLTISGSTGNDPVFQAPANNTAYAVKGKDLDCNGNVTGLNVPAIGIFGKYPGGSYVPAINNIISAIPVGNQANYTGLNATPDVEYLSAYPANAQTPSQLDAIAQAIAQNADVTIPPGPVTYPLPTVTKSALASLGMSSSNMQTVVINGNLDITGWTGTGYGLLVVNGKFTYDPATTWNGIVLVIGQGVVDNDAHSQFQQMNGAVFVAKTRDASGNLLPDPNLGGASVQFDAAMQGNGMRYSSCWIQKAQPVSSYKILSFHEISQ